MGGGLNTANRTEHIHFLHTVLRINWRVSIIIGGELNQSDSDVAYEVAVTFLVEFWAEIWREM